MKYMKHMLLFTLLGTTLSAITAADEAYEVGTINNQLTETFKAGNTARMVELYASDAVMLPPSSEILASNTAIKAYWDDLRQVGVQEYAIYPVNLHIEGNRAYASGLWVATKVTAEGKLVNLSGNISHVLEKQRDGRWKIAVQSWN